MRTSIVALLLCAACIASFANAQSNAHCVSIEQPEFVSRHCATLKPRRIAVVTARNCKDQLREQDTFAKAVTKHLNKSQLFRAVLSNKHICAEVMPIARGEFDELEILRISRNYNADAVLYCQIHEIDAVDPMHIDVSMVLIHAGEAVALMSTQLTYDLANKCTRNDYARFTGLGCDYETDILMHSPTHFIDFTARHSVMSMLSIW